MGKGKHAAAMRPAAFLLPAVLIAAVLAGCGPAGDLDTPGESLPDTGITVIASTAPDEPAPSRETGTDAADGQEQKTVTAGSAQEAGSAAGPVQITVTAGGSSQDTVEGLEMETGAPESADTYDDGIIAARPDAIYLDEIDGLPDGTHLIGMSALGIEDHSGAPHTVLNGGEPYFDIPEHPYDTVIFSALDDYGRAGPAYACFSAESLPERASAASPSWQDKPSGWQGMAYYGLVPGGALYHKQQLIPAPFYAGKLDRKNLVTATQYLSETALEPLTAEILEYLTANGGYMAVRVTPVYSGTRPLCDGVLVEAASIGGEGEEAFRTCTFCHNVQPGIEIDYRNGLSRVGDTEWTGADAYGNEDYIINRHDGTFHYERCVVVMNMLNSWREEYRGQRSDLIGNRYEACTICQP